MVLRHLPGSDDLRLRMVDGRRCRRHGLGAMVEVYDRTGANDSEAYAIFNDRGEEPLPFCPICSGAIIGPMGRVDP